MDCKPSRSNLRNYKSPNRCRCEICGACRSDEPERKFHRFPKNPELSDKWAAICNKNWIIKASPIVRSAKYLICSNHFSDQDYLSSIKKRLTEKAVPNVYIPLPKLNFNNLKMQLNSCLRSQDSQTEEENTSNCYKDGVKSSMWANDWNRRDDTQSAFDTQSQYSDALTTDSAGVETLDIRERMKKLFESQSFTDVTFYQKNNRRASISAHKAILAISSPFFTKMLFEQDTIMSRTGYEKLEVEINNIPFDAFTCIVKYLYTDEIFFENEALVQGVLDGAKQFGIYSLVNKCKEYFENVELTCENVCSKLQISTSNKITSLKDRCIEFIQKNTLPAIQSPDFQTCSSATIKSICKLQSFNLQSEMQLLEAVMQWLRSQPYHERRGLMESLVKCIRFLNLSIVEMGDVFKKYPDLMTPDEGLNIMIFLAKDPPKDPKSLPSWCNKNMSNRCFKDDTRGSMMGLYRDPNGALVGKIFFPLKSDPEQGFVSKLTSLLQMKCISGHHVLNALTLSFEKPLSKKCRINELLIKVHVNPTKFNTSVNVQIVNVNSETVRIEFKKLIKVRRGDTLDIEAEAKNIELYKFLQYDEAYPMTANPHFNICISCSPRIRKLYFISGIEYGPQEKLPNKAIRDRNS